MSYKLSAINKSLTDITHNSLIFLKATHNAKLPMPVRDKYALIYDEHTSSNDINGWPLILVKGTQVLPNQSANIINLNPELNYIGEDDVIKFNPANLSIRALFRNNANAKPIGIAAGNSTSHLMLFRRTFDSTLMRGQRTGSPVKIPIQ